MEQLTDLVEACNQLGMTFVYRNNSGDIVGEFNAVTKKFRYCRTRNQRCVDLSDWLLLTETQREQLKAGNPVFMPLSEDVMNECVDDDKVPRETQLYIITHDEYGAVITGAYKNSVGSLVLHSHSTRLCQLDDDRHFTCYTKYEHGHKQKNALSEKIYSNRTEYELDGRPLPYTSIINGFQQHITTDMKKGLKFLLDINLYPYNECNGVFICPGKFVN